MRKIHSWSLVLLFVVGSAAAATPPVIKLPPQFTGPPLRPVPEELIRKDAILTWYGQSFFVLTSRGGAKIAFDPYHVQDGLKYSPPPGLNARAVFVSHEHFDHNNAGMFAGHPKLLPPISGGSHSGILTFGREKIPYTSVFSYHDEVGGKERGTNTINVVTVDGVRIAHLGDLGTTLSREQLRQIGRVDILLLPVGGTFTIDAAGATKVVSQLKPRVVIPMHYKTDKTDLPLAPVSEFIRGKKNVQRNGTTFSFTSKSLPSKTTIVVLKYK